jgi:uncharacterized membrane protein (DUF485 family)
METHMIELPQGTKLGAGDALVERTVSQASLEAAGTALRLESFRDLTNAKFMLIAPLLGVSLVFITALALLSGYGRSLMSIKIDGSFNVGYLLVLATYALCWAGSVIYVTVANRKFEAAAERVARQLRAERAQ